MMVEKTAKDQVSVSRQIDASPEEIFDVLAHPARHSEIDGSGTVKDSRDGQQLRLSPGAKFSMDMRLGLPYRIKNTVVEFEEGRLIAWRHFGRHIWRYELEPVDGGTIVRETWDISREATLSRPIVRRLMGAQTRINMARTLERIESAVAGTDLRSI